MATVLRHPMQVDWHDKADVIAYADSFQSIKTGLSVIKRAGRAYTIVHTRAEGAALLAGHEVVYRTPVKPE